MLSINQMGKKFNVSRSTLLYYDKVGLLSPSARSSSNYRLYSSNDVLKMKKIMTYRDVGLPLSKIKDILNSNSTNTSDFLEQRLVELNKEISHLRIQQKTIVSLLDSASAIRDARVMTKSNWVDMLKASGMNDDDMHAWHADFERNFPQIHEDFLYSLGCPSEEVKAIRDWSKTAPQSK